MALHVRLREFWVYTECRQALLLVVEAGRLPRLPIRTNKLFQGSIVQQMLLLQEGAQATMGGRTQLRCVGVSGASGPTV